MVRHEAAEALAAIGSPKAIETISQFLKDSSAPVRETCILAIHSLTTQVRQGDDGQMNSESRAFNTVDPIQGRNGCSDDDVESVSSELLDITLELWKRYEALFTLRNIASDKAAKAIAHALVQDKSSALLRHEVAFVLGQLQNPCTLGELTVCLSNVFEHPMARHEAALAIGAIGCTWTRESSTQLESCRNEAIETLKLYACDVDDVVKESCIVGLDNISTETGIEISV